MRFQITLALSLMITSTLAVADCTEKDAQILQMRTTIDQLTVRVAQLVEENDRLEEATLSALASVREGKKVVQGCDVAEFEKTMAYSDWNYYTAEQWVRPNASNCTDAQIKEVLNLIGSRYNFEASKSILRFELKN